MTSRPIEPDESVADADSAPADAPGSGGEQWPMESRRSRIYTVVAAIPPGRVATYGQVAELAGLPRQARQVGFALAALPRDTGLPWHRVINARGEISVRARSGAVARQRARLQSEGVGFDTRGRVRLAEFRWDPGLPAAGDGEC